MTTDRVQAFRNLWWRARNLTIRIGSVLSISLIYFMLMVFVISVAFIYIIATSVLTKKFLIAVFMIMALLPIVSCSILVAEVAHRTTQKLTVSWESCLRHMIEKEYNESVLKELSSFFDFIALHKPIIELGGYSPINRIFNMGMGSAYATYIILFFQMQTNQSSSNGLDQPTNDSLTCNC